LVFGGKFNQSFDPIGVEVGGSGAAKLERLAGGGGFLGSFGAVPVEGEVVGVFAVMPGAKKVGFVPNFIVNIFQIFLGAARVVADGGGNKVLPGLPIVGRGNEIITHTGGSI